MPGGSASRVVRDGDTVRRDPGDRAEPVHELLRHFGQRGWTGAPRLLGTDGQGREVLTFLDGHVLWQSPADRVSSAESLAGVARLVRRLHDLTAGMPLADDQEVVCHNDLSPKNTVYRGDGEGMRPVALTDWDLAAPGARIHDIAHMCWQYLGLGPAAADVVAASHRVRLMCNAYGLSGRSRVVETILWWEDRCWRDRRRRGRRRPGNGAPAGRRGCGVRARRLPLGARVPGRNRSRPGLTRGQAAPRNALLEELQLGGDDRRPLPGVERLDYRHQFG